MAERDAKDKLTHAEVEYERTSDHPGRHCGNCEHVIEAMGGTRCEAVKNPIDLGGWCKRWEKK